MTKSQSCICCESGNFAPHFPGLLKCLECTHVWADVSLSDDELRAIYSQNYFNGDEYLDYEKERPALERNLRNRVRDLVRRHPAGGRLYEIGAAYGYFLRLASQHFTAAGCDISDFAADFARTKLNQDVTAGDYLALSPPAQPFNVVCLWDTIEHLQHPEQYLAKAYTEMAPGATLALSTGDIGSLLARLRGPKWRLIHPPSHLHYFTATSMTRLLTRLGFKNVEISHHAFWRNADAVAFRLLARPANKSTAGLYNFLHQIGLLRWNFPFYTGDLLTATAIKSSASHL
ncbi:MAG: class I SAM-dependent methyltransferase [Candidatus Sumerlaeaceae bacterium]|nr:class I SAM-dependent methyltransferase [Candidatus Sumerlaeaceae bacterium]